MANRDRHRQGLVYGPVRPSGPRDRGRIVGNLLGLLVVVVTVTVLALAIYFFAQSRGSQPVAPSASATHAAGSSSPAPSFSASPATVPSATAGASAVAIATLDPATPPPTAAAPTPEPTPAPPTPTPGPTVFVPPVMSGRGFITFGTNNDARFRVLDPKTTFAIDEPMVWSAYLTEPANASDVRIRILVLDASQPSGLRLVREDEVRPDVQSQIFFRRLRPLGLTTGPGLFTIQYVRGDQVLSQGSFLIQ